MTSSCSLQNKTVLNPRGKASAKGFSNTVRKYGGVPLEISLLAFKTAELSAEQKAMIENIHTYDWIIFTSNVAVENFLFFYSGELSNLPHVATIGKKTAQFVEEKGIKVEFIPEEFVAEGFVKEFQPLIEKGIRIFIPKGNLARDYIAEKFKKMGAIVDEIIIYDTYFPHQSKAYLAQMLADHQLDIIPFTSPSTAEHFMEIVEQYNLHDDIQSCIFACIGPVAQKRAEDFGLTVHVVPDVYTVEEMIKKLAEFISAQETGAITSI